MWQKILPLSLLLLLTLHVTAQPAQTPPKLRVAGMKFPPASYIDDTGHIYGPAIDQLSTFLNGLNMDYAWVGLSNQRIAKEIQHGLVDITLATREHRPFSDMLWFTQRPINCLAIAIFQANHATPVHTFTQLRDAHIAYYHYFDRDALINELREAKPASLTSVTRREVGWNMLSAGRVSHYIDFYDPAETTREQLRLDPVNHALVRYQAAYLTVPKNTPQALDLLKALNERLGNSDFVITRGESRAHMQHCE